MRTRRHALGQNFLHHKPTIDKIANLVAQEIEASQSKPRTLLEVGPGKLALTNALVPIAEKHDLPLVLVERDRYLEDEIKEGAQKAELHFMDAATDKFLDLVDQLETDGRTPLFFASNLPYSASSQILANLCYRSKKVSGAVVMVQKELAERIVAKPKTSDRGALSLLIQSYFQVGLAFDVGPGAFSPPPKVMSTVLTLKPLEKPIVQDLKEPKKFEHFCKMLFSQRRKMIRNMIPSDKQSIFEKVGIKGTERPEELELSVVFELYRAVTERSEAN